MERNGRTVPYGADETLYLVIDRSGRFGGGAETEVERADFETVIADLFSGQFSDPVRVIAFNTLEHWSRDVSGDVAEEVRSRCDIEGEAVPEHIQDFVLGHTDGRRNRRHPRPVGTGTIRAAPG